jgi:hypothetical protein
MVSVRDKEPLNYELNYECEVLDPVPTINDWWRRFDFHGDNLRFAKGLVRRFMDHQGIKKARFRKLGTNLWRSLEI